MIRLVLSLYLVLWLTSCSENPTTGVTDSANYVSGKVVSPALEPVEGSVVYLIKPEVTINGALYNIVDSAVTNESGEWEMKQEVGVYTLLSKGGENYAPAMSKIKIAEENEQKNMIISEKSKKTLFGRVFVGSDLQVSNVSISVLGTDIKTITSNDGRYILQNVPTGDCDLLYSFSGRHYVSSVRTASGDEYVQLRDVTVPDKVSDTLPNSEYDNAQKVTPVVYEEQPTYYEGKRFDGVEYLASAEPETEVIDFTGEKLLPLASFDYEGFETLINKNRAETDLNSVCFPYILQNDTFNDYSFYNVEGVWGDGFYSEFIYGDSTISTFGGVTLFFDWVSFDSINKNVDLTNVTSVNFYLKGDCDIKVMLQDSVTASGKWGGISQFETTITPTEDWQYYSIPIEELVCSKLLDSTVVPLNRDDDIKKIEYLKFITIAQPGDSVSFSVDEISLSGVGLNDLINRR